MQVCHALLSQGGRTFWNNHGYPFYEAAALLMEAARIEPKNAARECAIHRGLRLLIIHSQNSERSLPVPHPSAEVGWSERVFKIDASRETHHSPARKTSFQHTAQTWLVDSPRHPPGGRGSLIAIAAEVEAGRPGLSHTLYLQPERRGLYLRVQHPPYKIALVRPEVEEAFVMFAGNRIFRIGKIERNRAVLDNHSGA
jgi:hypothetical protein